MYVDVAAQLPQAMAEVILTYRLPKEFSEEEVVGRRVAVPFGRSNQTITAFVVAKHKKEPTGFIIKDIYAFLDNNPVLSPQLIELGLWIARSYTCTPYTAFKAMVPGFQTERIEFRIHLLKELKDCEDTFLKEDRNKLEKDGFIDLGGNKPSPELQSLADQGFLRIDAYFTEKNEARTTTYYHCILDTREELDQLNLAGSPRQEALLLDLWGNGPQTSVELWKKHGKAYASLNALVEKGYVVRHGSVVGPEIGKIEDFIQAPYRSLNEDQVQAINKIKKVIQKQNAHESLLYGVTGSGKTEVYIHAIEEVLQRNHQALLLVPEIALTMQLVGRLQGALKQEIGVWHSHMSIQDRIDMWKKIQDGEVKVLVGARSAIFAPFPRLGLILIDEAHESSYKQAEPDPRYHAVSVARKRAQLENCPLILGSATPGLAEIKAVQEGKIEILSLPERVGGRPMPEIRLVDMRSYSRGTLFSPELLQALEAAFRKDQQGILYLNRRGYAPMFLCRECGESIRCEACDIPMTYHRRQEVLRCHYCDRIERVPAQCPSCDEPALFPYGVGTEQVAQSFSELFPDIPYGRLDADTTRSKDRQRKILSAFAKKETKVLIGTQMLAKGFDFPSVTVCGMISADLHLNMADYRADEQTYQSVMQLAGRAGRGREEGSVYIQSYQPEHPVLLACQNYDSDGFYRQALASRRAMNYPPYVSLARVLVTHPNKEIVRDTTKRVHSFLYETTKGKKIQILGPSAAPIERIRGRYRVQFLLKAFRRELLEELGQALLKRGDTLRKNENCRILIDIDPENIL